MGNLRKTANGSFVDIDTLRLGNESVIAVGNLKVNARGDQLGPGGTPIASKQQVVNEYYNLHTPVVGARPLAQPSKTARAESAAIDADTAQADDVDTQVIEAMQAPIVAAPRPVRGALANTVATKK